MKFKTRIISTAVAAAVGTFAGAAQAVNLGADNQGQVLIYPYYTVQQKGGTAFDTYISVVNSDSVNGKAVKVRFLEGKNSIEVLDFNLYLSPNDMWTATVTRDASGNGRIRTVDNSCTAPEILPVTGVSSTTAGVERFASFVNFGYSGPADAAKDESLGRAREGYVEIIQMADIVPGLSTGGAPALNTFNASLHNSAGVPPNCAAIRNAWLSNDYAGNDGVAAPTGMLAGAAVIINPIEGTDITYDAVAIDRFSDVPQHFAPGSIQPQLSDVTPKNSAIFSGTDVVRTAWGLAVVPPAMPISALFMRNSVQNEYAIAAAPTGLGTDWVVTFPTKRQHISFAAAVDKAPFTSSLSSTGACELTTLTSYNREEGIVTSGLIFSPPPAAGTNALCWEVNVISMTNGGTTSNVLGGLTTRMTLAQPFAEGWMRMDFAQTRPSPAASTTRTNIETGAVTAGLASVYTGLPVLGLAAVSFVNTGTLPNTNYGGSQSHRYSRFITP
ncbi:MAG: hypothetical protein A3H27_11365 [Acidobacteria bacterium RIFCSPLOWO2_02_FULL_59_13]|nr:MAG: hypothetical protein A3H27_11365 [Acidobacteria bacterium RIFCSPLOWO2_02_FULL_59_13]